MASGILLLLILVVLSICSLFIGAIEIDWMALWSGGDALALRIILFGRVPRLLAILCTGVGMSVAGLIMQQLCRNKFVSPTTGATIQSAQLGIVLSMVFVPTMGLGMRTLFAFVMAVAGTLIFVFFTQRIRVKDTVLVPLIGIMFGNIIGGITGFIAYKYEMTQALTSWESGHFSLVLRGRYEIVYLVVPLIGIMFGNIIGGFTNFLAYQWEVTQQLATYFSGSFALILKGNYELVYLVLPLVILAFLYANHFNIVGMGQEFSKNLGVNYQLVMILGLTISAVITASVIVIVGQISYIGLIVPNIVALFKGDKLRGTLLDTALFGALFVLICDMIARVVIAPYEIPIELVVGVIGSVLFMMMLFFKLKYRRKVRGGA